ncbi:uncharacterized protein QYS62_000051 [Fusarium acuminatum]|uniref:Xylanolytic transcriptional activator regulatory domain-containing protein n=1 Tax=Fusarium acuminatum TaxID=5515 RepID=A0ABZ2WGU0_9HYPO
MSRNAGSDAWPSPQAVQERGSLRTLEKGKSQFIGSSSGIYFVNTVRKAFSASNNNSLLSDTTHPTPEDCIIADDEDDNRASTTTPAPSSPSLSCSYGPGIPTELGQPPQPDVAKHLFMIYFQTWHRFFPFLHGPTVLNDMEDLYSASRPSLNLPKVIILQSIFNLANLHGNNLLPAVSRINKPADVLSCLPSLTVKGDLVSIQALFASELLLVARMSLRTATAVGGLLSRAIFLAGLHRCPCRYAQLSIDECDIRKRLFWSIYVLDRYLSQALGHPLGIQDSDVDVCPLTGPELHHPQLQPTTPFRLGEAGLGASPFSGTLTDSSSSDSDQKHDRHLILFFQVEYSRLLGRALELFHKSLHIRSIDPRSILSLRTDINAWWNALPSSFQEYQSTSQTDTLGNQSREFNESAYFILLHSQLVLLSYRPWLSLEPASPEFQAALQTCISEAQPFIDDFREIGMCLDVLLAMSKQWKVAKNCHAVLCDLQSAFDDTTRPTTKRPFSISGSQLNPMSPGFVEQDVVGDRSSTDSSQQGPRKRTRIDSGTANYPDLGPRSTEHTNGPEQAAIQNPETLPSGSRSHSGLDDFEGSSFMTDNPSGLGNWDSGMPDLLAGITWESLLAGLNYDDCF